MFRDLARSCLLVVLAVCAVTAVSPVAFAENVGTSAVPYIVEPRPPQQNKRAVAPAPSARWSTYNFPPPNGGLLVFTIRPDGNPACASYDGGGCLWGMPYNQIDFKRLQPLVCGQTHGAMFGVTGYEDPRHWCNIARRLSR
jgi:hypothetical protein